MKLAYKIKPQIAVVTRFAFGSMDHPESHLNFNYKTLEKGFFESGVELNQLYKGFGMTGFLDTVRMHFRRLKTIFRLK